MDSGNVVVPDADPDAAPAPDADFGDAPTADVAPAYADIAPHCEWDPTPRVGDGPPGPLAPLMAGAAEGLIEQPVGTPLGGYTLRSTTVLGRGRTIDGRGSPWADVFVPSAGIQTRIPARALVLEAGSEVVFLIKADLPYGFDGLTFAVEDAISRRLGLDARGRVLLTTSHSHSAWGRFSAHFLYQQGMDTVLGEVFDGVVSAAAQVAEEAYLRREPARLGVGTWDDWDPDDRIYHDRRGADFHLTGGPHKDPRLSLLRVDRLDGSPVALVYGFGMHGIVADGDNPYASVDATGHIDLALEEQFDEPVVVMHLQGAVGDASPTGVSTLDQSCTDAEDCFQLSSTEQTVQCGGARCENVVDFGRMESLGELAAPLVMRLYDATPAASDRVSLRVVARTILSGPAATVEREHGTLRYAPFDATRASDGQVLDDLGRVITPLDEFNAPGGTFMCGETTPLPLVGFDDLVGLTAYGSCLDLYKLSPLSEALVGLPAPPLPLCETLTAQIALLHVGGVQVSVFDGAIAHAGASELLVALLPGEPVALLAEALRARSPAGPDGTWVVGVAQDHKGYLMQAEDWLAGGYEASINVWGPLEGEFILDQTLAWADWMMSDPGASTGAAEPPPLLPRPRYAPPPRLEREPDDTATPAAANLPLPGELLVRLRRPPTTSQPATEIQRVVGTALFVWRGGDPAVDRARVVLERENGPGGTFAPVLRRSGRPLDDRGSEIFLTYTEIATDDGPSEHLWAAEWQPVPGRGDREHAELDDFAGMTLGRYRFRVLGRYRAGDAIVPYALESDPFTVVPVGLDVGAERAAGGAEVTVRVAYPDGAGFRLLDLAGPSNRNLPVRGPATVTEHDDAGSELSRVVLEGVVEGSNTAFRFVPTTGAVTVRVTDRFGNGGESPMPPP